MVDSTFFGLTFYFIMKTKTVGAKVLKENLSAYLRLVKEGETILVMERNQVVAEIKKPSVNSDGTIENFLQREEKRGLLLRAKRKSTLLRPPSQVKEKFKLDWMKTYYEDRD
ncbi:antitoxin PHD [Leptospira interrogans]|nr:antitoxin PHD [Leptospira interrogans serovar Canicola]OMH69061.1 antitoxin PHD [Leptospira interrogans serovar Pomona]TQE58149.1 antitoxin PHD [Leptospira interrogans]ASV09451.1 antitoxin PHD [Leptospira interrogans serovar Canicola]OLZ31286.1 antitoxin PHD [Leptospira interrogans serovar Canicola]